MGETIEDKRNGGLRDRMHEKAVLLQRNNELDQELKEPETEPTI